MVHNARYSSVCEADWHSLTCCSRPYMGVILKHVSTHTIFCYKRSSQFKVSNTEIKTMPLEIAAKVAQIPNMGPETKDRTLYKLQIQN